jgi:hypothetical protein
METNINFEDLWGEVEAECEWQQQWDEEMVKWDELIEEQRKKITPEIVVDQIEYLELDPGTPIDYNVLRVDWEEEINKETTKIIHQIEAQSEWDKTDEPKEDISPWGIIDWSEEEIYIPIQQKPPKIVPSIGTQTYAQVAQHRNNQLVTIYEEEEKDLRVKKTTREDLVKPERTICEINNKEKPPVIKILQRPKDKQTDRNIVKLSNSSPPKQPMQPQTNKQRAEQHNKNKNNFPICEACCGAAGAGGAVICETLL